MKKLFTILIALLFATSFNGNAQCTLLNESFDVSPALSATNVDGAWYPDRFLPDEFVSYDLNGNNVLKISINGIHDGAANRPSGQQGSFYNTQGRKFNQCGGCVTVLKGDLWIPADWATKHRRSDMWATAYDNTNAISAYPIIGFRNMDGGSPGIYCYNISTGDWIDTGVSVVYDSWYSLEFRLVGSNLEYLVNDVVVQTLSSNGSTYLGNIIMQAYNFNDLALPLASQSTDSYDAFWDNLITTGTGGNIVTNISTDQTFCSIQSAINAATAGDKIQIGAGTYTGNITINKSLTIVGDPGDANPGPGPNAPVIDGGSLPGDAFKIANGVANVTIKGFEMRNFTSPLFNGIGNGISAWVGSTSNITIQDNSFLNLGYNGILVGNDKNSNPLKWGDHSNWTVKQNIVSNCGFIGFELTNTSTSIIEDNIIHLATPYIGAIFSSARRSETGLTIKNNQIDGTPSTAFPVIYIYAYDLDMSSPNLNNVLIEGNAIATTGTPFQIYVRNIGTGTVTNVQVHGNSLATLKNLTAGPIDATCNWWGSNNLSAIGAAVTGNVNNIPYLDNGLDAEPELIGFQPAASCADCPATNFAAIEHLIVKNKISICHNGKTISVNLNALPAHLAHGDCLGPCLKSGLLDPENSFVAATEIKVFPNPSHGIVNVEFTIEEETTATITLVDMTGKTIQSVFNNSVEAGEDYRVEIDTHNLTNGIYMVKMITDAGFSKIVKLIVN